MAIRYDPVGQCIYCGAKEGLAREHIIPFGLNGDLILPEASCSACATITGRIEQVCLKEMFGNMRHATGMKTRNKKDRPDTLIAKIRTGDEDDDAVEEIEVTPAQFPPSIILFTLPPARILCGLPDDDTPVSYDLWCWANTLPIKEEAEGRQATGTVIEGRVHPSRFSQMLAKIGHSFAVAALGLDAFKPLAIDLALGRTDRINYLVGSNVNFDIGPMESGGLHQLAIYTHESGTIVALIRLFGLVDGPLFHVVVGVTEGGRVMPIIEGFPSR